MPIEAYPTQAPLIKATLIKIPHLKTTPLININDNTNTNR